VSVGRRLLNPVGLGFASHVLAGALPFLSAGAIARLGLLPGTAALYVAGSVVVAAVIAFPRIRGHLVTETAAFARPAARAAFVAGLAGFLVAGVAYYVGLAHFAGLGDTARVAEYIFLTRLDWLVQAAFAIVWLREPWRPAGLAGAGLALTGGLLLAWAGAFGATGLLAATVYILASLAGYSCFKRLAGHRGPAGAVALTTWRHVVNTIGFIVLAATIGTRAPQGDLASGLALAAAAGVVLVVLFLLRFTALAGMPLWVLSAQAPTQALVAITVILATNGTLPSATLLGIGLVVVGEVMVTRSGRSAGP